MTGEPSRFGSRSTAVEEATGDAPDRTPPAADDDDRGPGTTQPAPPPMLRKPSAPDEAVIARAARRARDAEAKAPPAVPPTNRKSPPVAPAPAAASPERLSRRQRRKDLKRRARKVKRIVRHLDAWSVLKISFVFYLCVYVVSMVAAVLLWNLADGSGLIENIEGNIEELGAFETFNFEPDKLLQATLLGGAVLAVMATGLTALAAVLFNLIADLVGGIRLTVIEEPGFAPARRTKRTSPPKTSGSSGEASDTVSEPSGTISGL